jgi:hypothetical protein
MAFLGREREGDCRRPDGIVQLAIMPSQVNLVEKYTLNKM